MKLLTPDYYSEFKCIGGSCIDTCCAGWEVDVDKKSSEYYKSVTGPFGERIKSVLVELPVEDQFRLKPDKRCPFLNEANLCDLFTELGEEHLCDTCTNFPRHITEYGSTREIGISLSCPVSVRLIMSREKPIEFVTTDIDAQITEVNNIDAGLYFELVKARKTAIKFLQDRTIPILDRAALYLDLASKLQKCIKKPAKIETCNISYSDKDFLLKRLEELKKGSDKKLRKYTRIASKNGKNTYTQCVLDAWIELFDSLEHIKPEWDGILKGLKSFSDVLTCEECFDLSGRQVGKDDFLALRAREQYEYEHLLVYYAFRYFLRSVFDGKIYEKAALSIIALCMQLYLGMAHIRENGEFDFENQITLMRIYSKETEHSEENLEEIFKRISKDKMFSYNTFMYLLLR